MKISYSIILILLCLSDITCHSIDITKLLETYGSNMENTVSEISRLVTAIESNHYGKATFIKIILPTEDGNTIMPHLMEGIAQKLVTNWLVNIIDGFCCDSYETRAVIPQKPMAIEHTPDVYIIPLRSHDGLNYLDAQLNLMSEENSFNPGAIFLLITQTHQCGSYIDNDLTSLYFDKMWGKNCLSSIILFMSACDFKTTIITATPFSDNNVCRTVQENGTKQYNSKWLNDKISISIYKSDHKNFNKCPFSVGTIPSPPYVVGKLETEANKPSYEFVGGIDLELLNLASSVHNFTYVFDVKHGYGSDALIKWFPNGSMVGMFIDLLEKNLDISVGGIIPHNFNYYRYAYSGYYKFSSVCWAVNDASLAPQWKIFFGAFSQDVWIISGMVFLITSFIYFCLDHFVKTSLTRNCHIKCVKKIRLHCNFQTMPWIQYFSITLGLSSTLKAKSPSLRILFFSWSIYSLHMCIAYSSMLFLLITNPPLEKQINNIEDLSNSDLRVGSNLIVFQRFELENLDRTTKNILENHFICPSWKTCIEDLIKHKNFSILIKQDMLEYYINTKQSKVHRISEAFFSYGASVMTSKGNPLGPGFDKLVLLALQMGLVEKWDRDTKSEFQSVNITDSFKDSEKSASILTLSDFKGTFFVLLSGTVISLLLLIGELVISFLLQ